MSIFPLSSSPFTRHFSTYAHLTIGIPRSKLDFASATVYKKKGHGVKKEKTERIKSEAPIPRRTEIVNVNSYPQFPLKMEQSVDQAVDDAGKRNHFAPQPSHIFGHFEALQEGGGTGTSTPPLGTLQSTIFIVTYAHCFLLNLTQEERGVGVLGREGLGYLGEGGWSVNITQSCV